MTYVPEVTWQLDENGHAVWHLDDDLPDLPAEDPRRDFFYGDRYRPPEPRGDVRRCRACAGRGVVVSRDEWGMMSYAELRERRRQGVSFQAPTHCTACDGSGVEPK